MIKSISKCGYHYLDLLYVCTYVDCNYQTRLKCLYCCQPNEVQYHKHVNEENCSWLISLLKYHIDELMSQIQYFYFHHRHKELINSFLVLSHFLSCLCEYKLGNLIQQNYSNLLQEIGKTLNQLDFKEQDIYKIKKFIKQPNSIQEIENYSFLKIWRKYMIRFAIISDDENYLVLGWSKYIAIYQLNNLNLVQQIYQGNRFNYCQFTLNSRRLFVGCENVLYLYEANRQFIKIKKIAIKSLERVCVRNIVFIMNNVVFINTYSPPQSYTKIYKICINNNKIVYKLIFKGDINFQYDADNNMIIFNNQNSINIYQEIDKKQVIEYKLSQNLISQVQYIKDSMITAHFKSGSLLFFQINYKLKQIQLIRQINLIPKLFFYNRITYEIVAQTEQHLIIIDCHSYEQINIPYLMDNKKLKYSNQFQNRILRQQQNSLNFLITYDRNSIALYRRK